LIRNELPHETYLELAVTYYNLGMEEEAVQVLRQSSPNPMVSYWLAYLLRDSSEEESSSLLREADESSPYLVFPSRTESIPVLEWAQGKTESWKSKYYLSLIYWHINRKDKAAGLMELCGDMPDYAPFYIARGTLFLNIQSEYCHPCSDFTRAVDLAPGEWRTWHYLINFQQGNAAFSEELQNAQRAYSMFPKNPVIGTDYAKALLNSRRYQECLKILEKVKILPQEGAHEGHDIWEIANLGIAAGLMEKGKYRAALIYVDQSRTWPENLGAGKPYDPDNRFQDLLAAECYKRLGQDELAEESREAIIRYGTTAGLQEQDPVNLYISIKLMKESGRADSAGKLMDRWKNVQDSVFIWKISAGSSSPRARWLSAIHEGNEDEAENIAKEISSDPAENRFRLMIKTFNNLIQ
jgi:tetratricopeptide (TPR) repeat protein